ncbi:protein bric-a-brac 1-like isoform X3 [Neocloeon triangulifer]|uniref:protein bric-a-brac 1-like isoform X3 n=1 Tax=Neocloeon triangulifer TaxID=2078957 RepID=UPI00286F56BF|nr:protein bric-a-brac 1-like isoform X3 [Neocloeon triangulifer]
MAGAGDQFCLRWNNFQSNIVSVLDNLKEQEDLVDVTLVCEGHAVKAHKVILSACSPYFRNVFKENPCQHPIVILKDVHNAELDALLSFMYQGEVYISQDRLSSFLRTAEILQVRGLAGATAPANLLGEQTQTKNQRNKASAGRGTPPPLVPPHQQREATSPPQAKRRKTTPRRVVENASGVVAVPQVGVKQEPLDDEQLGICREEDQLKMDPEEEDEEPDEPFLPPSGSQSPLASDESTSMLARSLTAPRDATGSNSPLQSLLLSGSVDGSLTISDQQQQLSPGSQVARPTGGLPRVAQGGSCPHCGQEYANQSSLKYHVRLVHSEMTDRACCHLCPKSFRTRESFKLKQHMKDAHNVHY